LGHSDIAIKEGLDPDIVAQMVINSIRDNRLYILTNPDFTKFLEMRNRSINHDALELREAMRSIGIGIETIEPKTYIHEKPKFSVSYPGDWVVQNPTPLMSFNFMAVYETSYPNLIVHVNDAPKSGLKESINDDSNYFSATLGMESRIIYEIQTRFNDGTSAIEAEIELQLPDKANQLVILVLIAHKEDKVVRISLGTLKFEYDDVMKQKLRDIAYTLTFG